MLMRSSNVVAAPSGFAVLNTSAKPDDVVPKEVSTALAESVQPEFTSADIRAARRVLADEPVWLVPAVEGRLCMVRLVFPLVTGAQGRDLGPIPAQVCASEAEARAGELVSTHSLATSATRRASTSIVGIVPDGVRQVSLISRLGTSTTLPVIRNSYATVALEPASVTFVVDRGGRRVTRMVPLATFRSQSSFPGPPAAG
jgi:hypothetical protein